MGREKNSKFEREGKSDKKPVLHHDFFFPFHSFSNYQRKKNSEYQIKLLMHQIDVVETLSSKKCVNFRVG